MVLDIFLFDFVIFNLSSHRIYIREGHVVLKESILFDHVLEYLSEDIRTILLKMPKIYKEDIEEIRLRNGCPLNIYLRGQDYFISKSGKVVNDIKDSFIVNKEHINNTFQLITNHSVYAFTEEIKRGFITISGGHRVGIGGKVIYDSRGLGIEGIRDITSLNIRIAREKMGISDDIIKYLLEGYDSIHNTLIISPPQCGKTTLLRDIIRNLSDGNKWSRGFKVGLVDERSEIAGTYAGKNQKYIGIRTDVLDACLKSHGIMMLVRAMSPDIIAVDEIGGLSDIEAIAEGIRAGIKFIATVHGYSVYDVKDRAYLKELINEGIFGRYIILDRSQGVGTISKILDGESFEEVNRRGET